LGGGFGGGFAHGKDEYKRVRGQGWLGDVPGRFVTGIAANFFRARVRFARKCECFRCYGIVRGEMQTRDFAWSVQAAAVDDGEWTKACTAYAGTCIVAASLDPSWNTHLNMEKK
jgi:hypothetical protein